MLIPPSRLFGTSPPLPNFSFTHQSKWYRASMSNQVSLLKARYCLSVMQTAGMSPLEESRHLHRLLELGVSDCPNRERCCYR